jgi:hypothetical protein
MKIREILVVLTIFVLAVVAMHAMGNAITIMSRETSFAQVTSFGVIDCVYTAFRAIIPLGSHTISS